METNCIKTFFNKNGSKILSATASVGVVLTSIFSGWGTYKAFKKLQVREKTDKDLSKKDKLRIVLPHYVLAAGFGLSTIMCILGINILNTKQQNALTSAYMLLSSSYREYRNKVKELSGDEADLAVVSEIASKKLPEGKISENKVLFYEAFSKRYFESTMLDVMAAVYHYNRNFQLRQWASLNEFYDFLGIDRVEYGDYLGFNADQMWIDGFTAPWIDIHTQRAIDCDGKEFYILQFDWDPIPNYTEVTE